MSPPLSSLARDFFERILNSQDKISHLRGLVQANPPTYETEWLDFKGAKDLPDAGQIGPIASA
jgi:hypothetical protein